MTEETRVDRPSIGIAACVLAFGLWVIWEGASYDVGTGDRMGPGFYPVVLGVSLTLIAGLNLFNVARGTEIMSEFRLRPLLMIGLSVCAFAYLARPLGLVPATFALVFVAALAERQMKPLSALLTAIGLSFFGSAIFIYGLGVSLAVIRW